jgi:RHS repeat-associated protein
MHKTMRSFMAAWRIAILAALPISATAQVSTGPVPFDPNNAPVMQPPVVVGPTVAPSVPSGVAVGRTKGAFGISPSGEAHYSIPLWTPPGIAGLGASLALTYSSGAGDGWYGIGWSLAGLSTIDRCEKNYGADGIGANVILTSADRFCLDGKKLRSFAGTTYGADGAQYQTEVADFSLVISHGSAGGGPGWFEAHGKNGLIYQYGNTAHSALVATGTTTVITWALNRITDRFGNHMDFDYTNDTTNQVLRPLTITYTTPGTTVGVQTTPNFQVSFTYVSRAGTVPNGFISGAQFMEPYLTQVITVSSYNGSTYTSERTYNLTYVQSPTTGRSELQTFQECSPTQCFPVTTVAYQSGTAGWSADVATPGASGSLWTSLVVDLNGDGVDDIVYLDHATGNWYYLLGQRSGTYLGPYAVTPAPVGTLLPIDFNSDGKMDLMTKNSSGNWRILYFQSAGAAFTYTDTTVPVPANASSGYVMTGDVDGDGRDDLIYAVSSGSAWMVPDHIYYRLNTGTTFGAETTLATIGSTSCAVCSKLTLDPFGQYTPYNTRIRRPDVNGDGRVDFFVNIEKCSVDMGSCNGNLTFSWNLYVSDATAVGYDNLGVVLYGATGLASNLIAPLFGDFNGDGCTDVATAEGDWTVRYGTCLRSGATNALSAPVDSGVPAHGIYAMALDWDGDGLDDIVEPDTASGHFGYIRSTGTTFSPWTSTGLAYNNADTSTNAVVVVDTNGDGLYELAYPVGAGFTINVLPHKGATTISDVANSIADGFGVNFSPSYDQLTDTTIYVKGTGTNYPQQDIQTSRNVTSSYTASDGIGGIYTIAQAYYYERQNLQRGQSEGFAKVRTHDSRNGFYRFQQYGQLFPYTGLLSEDSLYQSNLTTFISDVTNTLASATLDSTSNNQRYFPYTSIAVSKNYEFNGALNGTLITQATTNYTFETNFTYGNLTKTVTATIDEDPTSPWNGNTFTDTINITPYEVGGTSATGWCIHWPSQVSETRLLPGGSSLTHTTALSVNTNSQCELDSKTVEPSSTVDKVVTALQYDGCGNINSSSVTGQTAAGAAMAARTTTASYGTHCIVPETINNALSQPTVLAYRYDLGLLTSSKDPNLLTTSWTYNDIGQKTLEARPDGTQTAYTPNACSSPSYCLSDTNTRYYVHRAEEDSTAGHATFWVSDQYFDQFDRLKYNKPQQSNGVQITQLTSYDNRGRLVTKTNPYGNGFSSFTTTTAYDDLNRPTSISRPIDSTHPTLQYTYFTYQGRTKTIEDPKLNVTTQISDVIGELSRVIDPDGTSTTNYAYNPFGALISATDPGLNATTTSFDTLGYLKTGSSDPDRGSWTTQYDSLGELANLRDAKTTAPAWTQQLTYDLLGRPLTRVEAEGTSTWTWGSVAANHEIGQLKQLSGLSDTEAYTFDAYGRPATHAQTWNSTTYTIGYAYNTLGKLDTLTYPATPVSPGNPFAVKYGYANGFLASLQDYTGGTGGTTLWQLTPSTVNMDPWGHVVDETLGTTTAVRIQSAYDAVTSWIGTRQVGSGGSSSNKQNLAYTWDENGNLSQREDLKQSLTEVFNYDNLNRIQNSTLNGTQNLLMAIDATGNITSRTEGGTAYTYTYNSTHKHAVATVGSVSYGYDANGNMTTRNGFSIGWSTANQPVSLGGSGVSASFSYGPDRQRKEQMAVYNNEGTNGTETTVYVAGLQEIEITPAQTHYKHFVQVPGGTQIIYDLESQSGAQTTYITADHLGSGNLLLDNTGTILINESFSAYGYRRTSVWAAPLGPASPAYTTIASTTRRGYTDAFHEMIDNLDLIHMNGRIYDPVIGRFLSPDPLGGHVGNSQSFNPYSYVQNRPLTLTDPTGLAAGRGGILHTPCEDNCRPITPSGFTSGLTGESFGGLTGTDASYGCSFCGSGLSFDFSAMFAAISSAFDGLGDPASLSTENDSSIGNNTNGMAQNPNGNGQPSSIQVVDAQGNPVMGHNPDGSITPMQAPASLPPSLYENLGEFTALVPGSIPLELAAFAPGGPLDAQRFDGQTNMAWVAYANYAFGIYTAAAGVPLDTALTGANVVAGFAGYSGSFPRGGYTNYPNLLNSNYNNIVNGYNAVASGQPPGP